MPFIILDRDGVINFDSDFYIKSPEEFIFIPGSVEAIAKLTKANYQILIVTNQSGVARGYYDLKTLEAIHEKLISHVNAAGGKITEIFFCPHHPDEKCFCRKPNPGLFHEIQKKYAINFADVFYIGDSLTDIKVAWNVGCKPVLVLTGNGKKSLERYPELLDVPSFPDLFAAINTLVGATGRSPLDPTGPKQ